ncbi:MAG: hypothetical protein KAV87_51115 [Desulfobacteraceae bacterium]|nr:hypothetical protein [Desulfobacteraceae bacterium]
MKALTLWPGWAWAVCHLGKRVENRGRPMPKSIIGQRIAIHAGANIGGRPGSVATREGIDDVGFMAFKAGWDFTVSSFGGGRFQASFWRHGDKVPRRGAGPVLDTATIPRKAIVATCIIHPVFITGGWAAIGLNHWGLSDVKILDEPVPVGGKQNFWEWKI